MAPSPLTLLTNSYSKVGIPSEMPDIIEFVTSPHFLDRPYLYPRQATLLKMIFLAKDLFTQYDYDVIGEWSQGFSLPTEAPNSLMLDPEAGDTTVQFTGDWGVTPDILDRIDYLIANGHRWFRTILAVLGRRSGKGFIGGLSAAYVLWYYMMLSDPKDHFGIDRSKRLACQVFAGKKMQARDNQWRDIVNVIMEAPCYQQYISQSLSESLTINSPIDLVPIQSRRQIATTMDLATFEIVPKEATTMAARGPASFMQFYDEMAHMVSTTGGSRSAKEVWDAATPSLDQFKKFAFIYAGSSPWQMNGQYYDLCRQALQVEADTKIPVYPSSLIIQLESWNIYQDWQRTLTPFTIRPECLKSNERTGEEEPFPEIQAIPLKGAIQEYDDNMRLLERSNRDQFRVERRSKWATALDAYFDSEDVRRMFAPWTGDPERLPERPQMQVRGNPEVTYVCHADPGATGSNFAFSIAHKVHAPGSPIPHVVFDYVKAWMPQDFEDGKMNYMIIEEELKQAIDDFLPSSFSFDQWNSIGMIQRLNAHSRQNYKVTRVWERTATAPLNWKTAETMKTALSLNLVHAPIHDLLEMECLFLRKLPGDKVDHPDSGPVTTKDVYDTVSICIHELIGDDVTSYLGELLSNLTPVGAMPGPNNPMSEVATQFANFSRERSLAHRPGRPSSALPTRVPMRRGR